MPTEEQDNQPRRRMALRRSRGGFAGGGAGNSTRAESLRLGHEDSSDSPQDEIDDAIDPLQMQNRVLAQARQQPAAAEDSGIPNPRDRMNQVAMAGSASYSREYRLSLLHRLLMRRVPLDQIAAQLQVSVSTIEKDRVLLKQRLRETARELNIDEMVGAQQEKYNEVAGMALSMATQNDTPGAMKLAAMRTMLAAEADRTRFLNTAGVFDVLRFRRAEDGSDVSDVARLMDKTNELMEKLLTAPEPQQSLNTRKRRPPRAGGFGEFTLDDRDASNSSDENVSL